VTGGWRIWASVARPHILSIIFASTLTYGWIFRGEHTWDLALLGFIAVWDWFIVNWTNKATDLEEDLANGIAGAAEVAAHKRLVEGLGWAMMLGGLVAGLWIHPELLPLRLSFTAVGIVYNYNVLGFKRLKERYFFKNFGSSILFTHSVFLYPLFGQGLEGTYPVPALLLSILFFLPLELTYEILYDLRDYEGDRKLGVPTFPVAHGPDRAKTIIYGLLAFSAIWPLVGGSDGPDAAARVGGRRRGAPAARADATLCVAGPTAQRARVCRHHLLGHRPARLLQPVDRRRASPGALSLRSPHAPRPVEHPAPAGLSDRGHRHRGRGLPVGALGAARRLDRASAGPAALRTVGGGPAAQGRAGDVPHAYGGAAAVQAHGVGRLRAGACSSPGWWWRSPPRSSARRWSRASSRSANPRC
jgi:4-hydroxybenzoate polyprenyltransferase